MPADRTSRLPLAGIAYVALVVASSATVGITPSVDQPIDEIVSFYGDNDQTVLIGSVLFALAAVAFLFFIGALRHHFDAAGAEADPLASVAHMGGGVASVGMLIFAGLGVALADAADDVEPAALQALNALNVHMYLPLAGGIFTLLVATGIVAIRGNSLPKWLAWSGIVVALLVFTPMGFFAFLLSIPWVLAASIILMRRDAAPPTTTPAI